MTLSGADLQPISGHRNAIAVPPVASSNGGDVAHSLPRPALGPKELAGNYRQKAGNVGRLAAIFAQVDLEQLSTVGVWRTFCS
jgi:hypothetical protein